jgi:ABC-type polysaccharide/polyol phosphate transport system ATPase subunit
MNSDIAIKVDHVSKTFKIPHEKVSSLRGAAVAAFKKKSYEEFKALDDVSFEVKKGEFFGIIGRNGSGKSTLLKILAGIYQADKGKVKINGRISPFLELGIGFNPELSGRDNVYLNATVLGLTKKEIDEKFDSIVKFSELERFIDQKLKNYSSGMQVRLAFSVSIHANREILLMDEVLAVGDSNFQSKCLEEFNRYREMGKTVILVTHDISTVERYCNRALLIRNGKILKIGKAVDIANAYVYENMSDEEKRMHDEEGWKIMVAEKKLKDLKGEELEIESRRIDREKKRLKNNRKIKTVEITKVEFLDKNGKEKKVFETGDDIMVKIFFKKNKKAEKINIGIGFYKDDNSYVLGYNTRMDDYIIGNNSNNVSIFFNAIPFLSGNYFLNVVCFGDVEQEYYDVRPKLKSLKIFSSGKKQHYRGVLALEHKWDSK